MKVKDLIDMLAISSMQYSRITISDTEGGSDSGYVSDIITFYEGYSVLHWEVSRDVLSITTSNTVSSDPYKKYDFKISVSDDEYYKVTEGTVKLTRKEALLVAKVLNTENWENVTNTNNGTTANVLIELDSAK